MWFTPAADETCSINLIMWLTLAYYFFFCWIHFQDNLWAHYIDLISSVTDMEQSHGQVDRAVDEIWRSGVQFLAPVIGWNFAFHDASGHLALMGTWYTDLRLDQWLQASLSLSTLQSETVVWGTFIAMDIWTQNRYLYLHLVWLSTSTAKIRFLSISMSSYVFPLFFMIEKAVTCQLICHHASALHRLDERIICLHFLFSTITTITQYNGE